MATYKISLLGLYNYSDTLFDNLTMPTVKVPSVPGLPTAPDKDALIATILEKSSDFPVLYPNFDFMKFMIGVWSKNCQYMMKKLWESMGYDYTPIDNYDRDSSISRTTSTNASGTSVGASTAFNSDTFKDTGKTTDSSSAGGTETITEHVHGNIGVTTTQQMLTQEREIALFPWYEIVAQDFINKFCIQVY